MEIIYDKGFDDPDGHSRVFQVILKKFYDDRGYFTEVLKTINIDQDNPLPDWFQNLSWIKQINRSQSSAGTVRGCHAQKGKFCQGKLVEAINTKIYDIITDARPDSKTFGVSKVYVLMPAKDVSNLLWVPRGFLHAFAVPNNSVDAIFQYYCDNVYDKASEVGVNPKTLLPKIAQIMQANESMKHLESDYADFYQLFNNNLTLSEKDCNAQSYESWMQQMQNDYVKDNVLWYK